MTNKRSSAPWPIMISLLTAVLVWLPGSAQATWHQHAPSFSGDMQKASLLQKPRPARDYRFAGPDGQELTLADFRGKIVFLNFWATWCPPCIEEMPSLDRLQANLGGPRFEVLALSLDRTRATVERFFQDFDLGHLAIYMDEQGKAMQAFSVGGLPTTLFVGPEGNLLGGLAGPADWSSDSAATFASYFIEQAPE